MQIGSTQSTEAERMMQKLSITVLESRRMPLGSEWHLDLCSPFWRFYVNTRSGAWMMHRGHQDYIHFAVRGLPARFFSNLFDRPLQLPSTVPLNSLNRQWRRHWNGPADLSRLCWAAALAHAAFANIVEDWLGADAGSALLWQEQEGGLHKAIEILEAQLSEPPTNSQLARLSGTSEDHFIRRFRQATGMTPASYGRARRVAHAAELLTSTNRTIEDIAAASGFTDRFHFSRVFKDRFGQAPGTYRTMHRRELAALVVAQASAEAAAIS